MKRRHPRGRPTSYRPEFCGRIVALMAEGRSLEGCAALLGVHPDSLYEWQKVHPEFSVAVRAGRAAATTFWENRLLDVANGGAGNAQAIQWAFRNRSRATTSNERRPEQPLQISTFDPSSTTRFAGRLRKSAAAAALRCMLANSFSRQLAMPLPIVGMTMSRERK